MQQSQHACGLHTSWCSNCKAEGHVYARTLCLATTGSSNMNVAMVASHALPAESTVPGYLCHDRCSVFLAYSALNRWPHTEDVTHCRGPWMLSHRAATSFCKPTTLASGSHTTLYVPLTREAHASVAVILERAYCIVYCPATIRASLLFCLLMPEVLASHLQVRQVSDCLHGTGAL